VFNKHCGLLHRERSFFPRNDRAAEVLLYGLHGKGENRMKKLLFAAAAVAALFVAAPANAQVYLGADPGGVGVQVGPVGVGIGDWRYRHGWRDTYYRDCHVVRERIVTPSGNIVYQSRRICD
jgi:hypothetical protein